MDDGQIAVVYDRCAAALAKRGIRSHAVAGVLFGMVIGRVGYTEALEVWAECSAIQGWDSYRWHTEICYDILIAGLEEQPGRLLLGIAEELSN